MGFIVGKAQPLRHPVLHRVAFDFAWRGAAFSESGHSSGLSAWPPGRCQDTLPVSSDRRPAPALIVGSHHHDAIMFSGTITRLGRRWGIIAFADTRVSSDKQLQANYIMLPLATVNRPTRGFGPRLCATPCENGIRGFAGDYSLNKPPKNVSGAEECHGGCPETKEGLTAMFVVESRFLQT